MENIEIYLKNVFLTNTVQQHSFGKKIIMAEKIKLIWDFRGESAAHIAKHHAKHLKDYAAINNLMGDSIGQQTLTPKHHIAYMIVPKSKMITVRDALKPHRGEIYTEDQ